MEKESSKRIEIIGKMTNVKITTVLARTVSGNFYQHNWCIKGLPNVVFLPLISQKIGISLVAIIIGVMKKLCLIIEIR